MKEIIIKTFFLQILKIGISIINFDCSMSVVRVNKSAEYFNLI